MSQNTKGQAPLVPSGGNGSGERAGAGHPAPSPAASRNRQCETESVAIIGLGCRFPGAQNPEAFWQLLLDGVDAVGDVPAERFDIGALYDPRPGVLGKIITRRGGFLEQVDHFDASFFAISPREAARMDPQHRLLLEVAWEALEDAGQVPERLAGSQTGVFVGMCANDYEDFQLLHSPNRIDIYTTTGGYRSVAAGRLSYTLGLEGPSLSVDTACSSSLVAVHLACQSIRSGECALALAAGANLILHPEQTFGYSSARMLSPDGRCKFGDASADGFVRSEGVGVVVLKPLSAALADGDPVYAVIRASAVNNDGRSGGLLMTPSRQGQEAVLRTAYRQAGISPGRVRYIEAHGTGTKVGDPIELQALGAVLAEGRPAARPCLVGSVKTNIGHTEGAAGIAGLIKVALSLKHGVIPASLHFREPNPDIPWQELPLLVQQERGAWPSESEPFVAGVNSFGICGTNAHVVLEEAPRTDAAERERAAADGAAQLLPLSASSAEALAPMARAYQAFVSGEETAAPSLRDICHTAGTRRTHHDHRLTFVAHSRRELAEHLRAYLQGEVRPGMSSGIKVPGRERKVVFVFAGQGSQWFGMGRQLLEQEPAFRAALAQCDEAMREYVDWSVLEQLAADAAHSRLDEINVIQPTLFAVQVALAALWRSWGVEPDAVIGQSMGEVAAAQVAGALSLEDAARVICRRSRLLRSRSGRGRMAVVELSLEQARRALAGYEDRLSIAVSSSPVSTVLSGDPAALEEIARQLQREEVFCRLVNVDVASHSPQMEPLRAELLEALEGLRPRPPLVPIYSTVTEGDSNGARFDAGYWWRNLREPVLFSSTVERLLESGHNIFLELGPHPILQSAIQQVLHHLGREGSVLASLRREEEERAVMLGSLGALYASGYPVDWNKLYPPGAQCVRLPSYPWQRERFWLEGEAADAAPGGERQGPAYAARNPLLGKHLKLAHPAGSQVWEIKLDARSLAYLDDHRVEGDVILPGTAYMELVLAAAAEALGAGGRVLSEVEFHKPLFMAQGAAPVVQLVFTPNSSGDISFQVYSRPGGAKDSSEDWVLHSTGTILRDQSDGQLRPDDRVEVEEIRARCPEQISGGDFYLDFGDRGNQWGPNFQGVRRLWKGVGEVLAELQVPQVIEPELGLYQFHPAVLDACCQVLAAAPAADPADLHQASPIVFKSVSRLQVYRGPSLRLWSHARLRPEAERKDGSLEGDIRVFDETGRTVAELKGVNLQYLEPGTRHSVPEKLDDWFYELCWEPKARAGVQTTLAPSAGEGKWLVFADAGGVGRGVESLLKERGETCVLVSPAEAYRNPEPDHYQLNPARPEDFQRLLADACAPGEPPCRGVVHLWSLEAAPAGETTAASLEEARLLGCVSVLHLTQALVKAGWDEPPRLWLVTGGAQGVEGEGSNLSLAQSPLWGLGRVVFHEHPEFRGRLVDLGPDGGAGELRGLCQEFLTDDGEDQVALRADRRYVARLVRHPKAEAAAAPGSRELDANGAYLITGGLGDLGLVVARWMVGRGARRIILVGRTKLPPRAEWGEVERASRVAAQVAAVRELEAAGAQVHLAAADVTDETQLRSLLEAVRLEGWPPVRGVVHAAGTVRFQTVLDSNASEMAEVLRPKVVGGWLLHRLFQDEPLDFFILFSSATAFLSSPLLGSYAAANAFLDALARYRRGRGQTALSINWGFWDEVGIAVRYLEGEGGKLRPRGMGSFTPAQALEALELLLAQSSPQVAVMPISWPQWSRFYPSASQSPMLSHLVNKEVHAPAEAAPTKGRRGFIKDRLAAADPGERQHLLATHLTEQVTQVLRLPASRLSRQQPLNKLGLDSLMAVELKNRIEIETGVVVPVVKFLRGPSIDQLATLILDQLEQSAAPSLVAPVEAVAVSDWEEGRL